MLKTVWDKFENPLVRHSTLAVVLVSAVIIATLATLYYQKNTQYEQFSLSTFNTQSSMQEKLASVSAELTSIKEVDQVKLNQTLQQENKQINETFKKSSSLYESLLDLKIQNPKLDKKYDTNYAKVLSQLASRDYNGASVALSTLEKDLAAEKAKLAPPPPATPAQIANAPVSNAPPSSGSQSTQKVQTDRGEFSVNIIAADLNSTKVIVDTASESDCKDNCPVSNVGTFASRSGAFAGINGPFFCPADYPSCAGKTNSFDTLLMNKNKTYFNSDNNVYSSVPAAIFSAGSARFVGRSQDWGRDTGVDSVIANYPLYISGGNNNYGGSSDPKIESKGTRTFIANKGSMVYMGLIYGASATDAAAVLKTLGMENALGLDQGGSTTLWFNGRYLAGPGRGIPAAILFVRR